MYLCRPAELDDYAAICTFPQDRIELFYIFPKGIYPLTPDQIKEALTTRVKPTVITQDSIVIGFANFYGYEEGVKCSLGNFIISPIYRGKGAAAVLLNHMIDTARNELNVTLVQLSCHITNTTALQFYTKFGFKPYRIAESKDHQGLLLLRIDMEMSV